MNNDIPFSFDFLFDSDDNDGFESNPLFQSGDVSIDVDDTGEDILITIENGNVSNITLGPEKWVLRVSREGSPEGLKLLLDSKNDLGTNVLLSPTDIASSHWEKEGATIEDQQLIEDDTNAQHFISQNLLNERFSSFESSAVISAIVEPVGRQHAWLGIRKNNRFFMAVFDLSLEGSVTYIGPEIDSAMIQSLPNNQYQISIGFEDNLPANLVDVCLGAADGPGESNRSYEGVGEQALNIYGIQLSTGIYTLPPPEFQNIEDRLTLKNQVGPSTLLSNESGSRPNTLLSPVFHRFDGKNDMQRTPSLGDGWEDYKLVSAAVCFTHNDGQGVQHILGQWGSIKSWQIGLDASTMKPFVRLSDDGHAIKKHFGFNAPIESGKKYLVGFAYNGFRDTLSLFLNESFLDESELHDIENQELKEGKIFKSDDFIYEGGHDEGSFAGVDIFRKWLYEGILTEENISELSKLFLTPPVVRQRQDTVNPPQPVIQLLEESHPEYAIGNPKTEAELVDILINKKNVTGFKYVDNRRGNDVQNDGSSTRPFRTIQHLLNELRPGEAGIIRGSQKPDERYSFGGIYRNSGANENKRIWLCGSPDQPPILDASESFNATWTQQPNGNWRASYNRERLYSASINEHVDAHESVWMTHQLIFDDKQLKRISQDRVPTLTPMECYFEIGNGSIKRPQFVHCRLPGNEDPNKSEMRIGSNRRSMLDYIEDKWEGMPGSGDPEENTKGMNFIGLWGLHFRFGCAVRKRGMTAIRGRGWHVEHCAFMESNACGVSYYGSDHFIYNNHFSRNGQYGYREEHTNGCIFQRNYIQENNLHDFPSSFAAGGCKISYVGLTKPNETLECYFADNRGVGEWFDIDNGKGATQTPAVLSHHNFYARNMRGGYFNERTSLHISHSDCVVYCTLANIDGKGKNKIGPGIRTQAASQNIHRRVVSVYNEGKGILYKTSDTRAGINKDTFDYCSFIQNARVADIDLGRVEIQGGDDESKKEERRKERKWTSSLITNLLVSNNQNGVNLFQKLSPGPREKTNNPDTFENWSGAKNTKVIDNPASLVEDFSDERNCYKFKDGFKEWEPQDFTHPLDFGSHWKP